jgi:hypothetical protein
MLASKINLFMVLCDTEETVLCVLVMHYVYIGYVIFRLLVIP